MTRIFRAPVLSSALFLAHTGCVTSNIENTCTIEGAELLSGNLDSRRACEIFEQNLAAALAEAGVADESRDYSVAISIAKRGTLEAQLVERLSGGETKSYPVVAIDVMDRPMQEDDLGRLARGVAGILGS